MLARALEEACPRREVSPEAAALQQGDRTLDALADGGDHLRVCRKPARRRRVKLDALDRVRDATARGGQLEVRGGLEVLLVEVVVEVAHPTHDGDDGRVGLSHAAELEEVLGEGRREAWPVRLELAAVAVSKLAEAQDAAVARCHNVEEGLTRQEVGGHGQS